MVDEYIRDIPNEVREGIYQTSSGLIDQLIKIHINMQLEYINSNEKPLINREFVLKVLKKYYPGTIIHLNKKYVKSITNEKIAREAFNSLENQVINNLKEITQITNEIFNDENIINSVKVARKRSPNGDVKQLCNIAYKHLKQYNRSDNRNKKSIDYDLKRELILNTSTKL